jgi:protein SCO1/2/putative membrane protein
VNAPNWVYTLPSINAALNTLATVLLVSGYLLIHRGQKVAHKRVMLSAFATSVLFLVFYLTYHFALKHYTGVSSKPFQGQGLIRPIYFTILITHVILAAVVPFLAMVTIYRGLKGQWAKHRRIARITFPIWLYVSLTGVIIYGMLYRWPV